MYKLFLSHSPRDQKAMVQVRDLLVRAGYHPWIDKDPRPGQDWRFAIDDAIFSADAVLVLVTPAAAESVYVTYEWALAIARGIPVVPIILKPARIHPRLQSLVVFDLSGWRDANQFWDYFLRELARMLSVAGPAGAPRAPATAQPLMPPDPPPAPIAPPTQPEFNRSVMPTESGHWIVVRRGPNLNAMFKLEKSTVTLGRDSTNDIAIQDPEVSRFHLRFTWQNGIYFVEDLGSTNGTLLDGVRMTASMPLNAGKVLRLGDTIAISYEIV